MREAGCAKIITDTLIGLEIGDIVDVQEYEEGEERQDGSTGSIGEEAPEFAICDGQIDVYRDEIQFIQVT